jgi:hypothetical protein
MDKDVDFTSLVPGGSLEDEELYWQEGFYADGTPIDEDELDRLAQDHFALLYDAAFEKQVERADYLANARHDFEIGA